MAEAQAQQPREASAPAPVVDTTSPEFQAAVAAAARDAAKQAVAELLAAAPRSSAGDPEGLIERLAMSIAELNDQGAGRKRVAPEVLQRRAQHLARAAEIITEARRLHQDGKLSEMPRYKLIAKVYLNERFLEPWTKDNVTKKQKQTEIYWLGMPNDAMRPVNQLAEQIYREYREGMGGASVASDKTIPPVVPDKRTYLTPSGLVVVGEAPASLQAHGRVDFKDELDLPSDPHDPNAEFINVLGTVHAPARQGFGQSTR